MCMCMGTCMCMRMFLHLLIERVELRPVPHAVALDLRMLAPQRWVDRPWPLQRGLVPGQG